MNLASVTVLFTYEKKRATYSAIPDKGLFCLLSCFENSPDVIAFKVVSEDGCKPEHFGWGSSWTKWVSYFTEDQLDRRL